MKYLFVRWVCVFALLALPVIGCGEVSSGIGGTGDTGGPGGAGGTGGTGGTGGAGGPGGPGGTGGVGVCQGGECPPIASRFPCTEQGIRDAIDMGGGPHGFDCDGPTTVFTEAEIVIDNNVILDGEGNLTVNGNLSGFLSVTSEVSAELRGLTVSGGCGIANHGMLSITSVSVSDAACPFFVPWAFLPGVMNWGLMRLTNSTVSSHEGSGIWNYATLTLINSTVSSNENSGIENSDIASALTLINSTVSGNSAYDGSAIWNDSRKGSVTIMNSLVEGACGGSSEIDSDGHNIESPGDTCGFDQPTDQVNVSTEDLKLGSLADNGGPTMTHALLLGSVAIDVIPEVMCVDADGQPLTTDQRGPAYPRGPACDVGAFELAP